MINPIIQHKLFQFFFYSRTTDYKYLCLGRIKVLIEILQVVILTAQLIDAAAKKGNIKVIFHLRIPYRGTNQEFYVMYL